MRALIIGSGTIGALYDTPDSEQVLTHAHALSLAPEIEAFAFVDIDKEQLSRACALWQVQGYESLEIALSEFKPQLIYICTPPHSRIKTFEKLSQSSIKYLICEKPLASSLEDAKKIMSIIENSKFSCNVNYGRRFDKTLVQLKADIEQETFGKLQAVRAIYTKGTLNNGGHLINLMLFLLGECIHAQALARVVDYSQDDPTTTCHLKFDKCSNVLLLGLDQSNYTLFEYEFLFEKKRISYTDRGYLVSTQETRVDPVFPNHIDMSPVTTTKSHLESCLTALLQETISERIDKSCVKDALKTIEICKNLL